VDGVIDSVAPDLPAPTVGEKALPIPSARPECPMVWVETCLPLMVSQAQVGW